MEADRIYESIGMCILDHMYIRKETNNIAQWISVIKLMKETARLSSRDYSDKNKKMQDKIFT